MTTPRTTAAVAAAGTAAAAVAASLVVQAVAAASPAAQRAVSSSVSVVSSPGTTTHGPLWRKYPGLHAATDLRRATYSVSGGTLKMGWTQAGSVTGTAVDYTSMSGTMGRTRLSVLVRYVASGKVTYTSVVGDKGGAYTTYCVHRVKGHANASTHVLTATMPVSCLPAGRHIDDLDGGGYVAAHNKAKPGEVTYGDVGSDTSDGSASTLRVR